MKKNQKLTTRAGAPVADNQNIVTAGPRGPLLMQDVWFLEKLAHFDREVIPERRVHAKRSGPTEPSPSPMILKYTKASIFAKKGKKLTAFSVSHCSRRTWCRRCRENIRGFAMKFYTDQGNWDLVGNNTLCFSSAIR